MLLCCKQIRSGDADNHELNSSVRCMLPIMMLGLVFIMIVWRTYVTFYLSVQHTLLFELIEDMHQYLISLTRVHPYLLDFGPFLCTVTSHL
jgi:hypothetical protein